MMMLVVMMMLLVVVVVVMLVGPICHVICGAKRRILNSFLACIAYPIIIQTQSSYFFYWSSFSFYSEFSAFINEHFVDLVVCHVFGRLSLGPSTEFDFVLEF